MDDIAAEKRYTPMRIEYCFNWKKVIAVSFVALLFLVGIGHADEETCFHCGMLKSQFGHSWVVIEDDNGKRTGVCSVHCAAIDMVVNMDNLIKTITVADYHTKKQIDAYLAYWVIGGDLPGVMTSRAKWAFEKKDDADAFINDHGGQTAVLEEVIRAAFVDLYEDTIVAKRKRRIIKMEKNKHSIE